MKFPPAIGRTGPSARSTHWLGHEAVGTVASEFAVIVPFLLLLFSNLTDAGFLIWAQMEVDFAAQMGSEAGYATCSAGSMPATTNCSGLSTAVSQAISGTTLGSAVSSASGFPSEVYYCPSGGTLTQVGTAGSPPSPYNCSIAGNAAAIPGDYLVVKANYSFSPFFRGLSLIGARTLSGYAVQRLK